MIGPGKGPREVLEVGRRAFGVERRKLLDLAERSSQAGFRLL